MIVSERRRWFWFVQALTSLRILFAFLFVVITPYPRLWPVAAALYSVAWATDFLDGKLARAKGVASKFGGAMDIFGDRYLTVVSILYVGFRGVDFLPLSLILLRELYSVSMKMVQIDGRGFMVSNPKVGGVVHFLIAAGTLNILRNPNVATSRWDEAPFWAIAAFYSAYLPWTIVRSWGDLKKVIRLDS